MTAENLTIYIASALTPKARMRRILRVLADNQATNSQRKVLARWAERLYARALKEGKR